MLIGYIWYMFLGKNKSLFWLLFALLVGAETCFAANWRFDIGMGSRNQAPLILIGGLGYKDVAFRIQGMGYQKGSNDYWCSMRGSLLWTFFTDLPFHFDVGLGGGYEYAEAPNKMHQALNHANGGTYLYPYNYKEALDLSLEIWTHLYGFYTQISVPAYHFREHDSQNILWGAGYMVEF